MTERGKALSVLAANTLGFAVCFAAWMLNGVLVTFLVDAGAVHWDKVQIGWLIGIPVLTGSLMRLPLGVLTDRYGGRSVNTLLMLGAAVPMWLLSYAQSYGQFVLASLGFGITGGSFAVGIAYTSVWFKKEQQGTALGVFGAGNAGAALTSIAAPQLLAWLTSGAAGVEGWRGLPRIYAAGLAASAVLYFLCTFPRKAPGGDAKSLGERLRPLRELRVWRFGLYYFFVFGGFVALAQWLIPYYVNVYAMSLGTAGLVATIFTLPSGVIRALGGWMSDRWGARSVMYWVLAASLICCALLIVPRMDITSPGEGVMAPKGGTVTLVTPTEIRVGDLSLPLSARASAASTSLSHDPDVLVWPELERWNEPIVTVGDVVKRRQLLARGVTHIYFQANVWIFTALVLVLGVAMGIGKAAVYKHIPVYFPDEVGVVGGVVGVIGGLGGFACPILFGYLLGASGIWTTCWMFLLAITVACLVWMHRVVRRILRNQAPGLVQQIRAGGAEGEPEPGSQPSARPAGSLEPQPLAGGSTP
jgi:NNP family nitrate/nitrite transporter-like MFS transporter